MDYSRNVINDNFGVYLKYDYLIFPVNLKIVPKIKIGNIIFYSKTNYHVSLLCLEGISKSEQQKIFEYSKKYIFKLGKITNKYRLVTENKLQSIIVRVRFTGLKRFILSINKKFSHDFKYPPTHITLFTLKGQTGIGVNTYKSYRDLCSKVSKEDIRKLENSLK